MGSIYKRGERYYVRFKDQEGKWVARAAADNLVEAKKILKEVEKGVKLLPPARPHLPPEPQSMTVRELFPAWVEARKARGLRGWLHSKKQFEIHVLPVLGDMKVADIRVRHIRNFIDGLPQSGLSPRSIRWVYALTRKFFTDQVVDEVIPHTPCVLTKDQLPKNRDRDPSWRAGALFSREEVELILSSPDIPEDRRMLNALLLMTGARLGEICGLKWSDIDSAARPLQKIVIARSFNQPTKTETPRQVPIHPLLAALLETWRAQGFVRLTGRTPTPTDLVIPSRAGRMRGKPNSWAPYARDLEQLGLRHRRIHDTRRTFITLARVDGARVDVLSQITHNSRGNIMDMYTTLPWHTLCEAMSCLKLRILTPAECAERQLAATEVFQAPAIEASGAIPECARRDDGGANGHQLTQLGGKEVVRETSDGLRPFRRAGNGVGRTRPLGGKKALPVTDRVTRQAKKRVKTQKSWKYHAKSVGVEIPDELSTNTTRRAGSRTRWPE